MQLSSSVHWTTGNLHTQLQWTPSNPATLGTSQRLEGWSHFRGKFALGSILWDTGVASSQGSRLEGVHCSHYRTPNWSQGMTTHPKKSSITSRSIEKVYSARTTSRLLAKQYHTLAITSIFLHSSRPFSYPPAVHAHPRNRHSNWTPDSSAPKCYYSDVTSTKPISTNNSNLEVGVTKIPDPVPALATLLHNTQTLLSYWKSKNIFTKNIFSKLFFAKGSPIPQRKDGRRGKKL